MDTTANILNFDVDVIQRSHERPVLVDFWAPWCGPCRTLGPVLESLAEEFKDRLDLVKINTEQEQALAGQFGIRSIPQVKLFVDGKVTAEFSGALPEPAIREWLQKMLPSPLKEQLEQAELTLRSGDLDSAQAQLGALLELEPENPQLLLLFAKACIWSEPATALQKLGKIPLNADEATQAEQLIELARQLAEPKADDGSAASSALATGLAQLSQGDIDAGSQSLLDSLKADRKYADGAARKAMLGLLAWLEPDQLRVAQLRSKLSAVLFS